MISPNNDSLSVEIQIGKINSFEHEKSEIVSNSIGSKIFTTSFRFQIAVNLRMISLGKFFIVF